jgi:type IV pilus assembly protein PilE
MGKKRGFTLIELMIAMVVIAILAAIGFPSYQEYLRRGKRAEGKAHLMRAAQQMERYYSLNNCYPSNTANCSTKASCGGNASSSALALCHAGINAHSGDSPSTSAYNISVTTNAQDFTLTATPTFTDTKCGNLGYNNAGAKTKTGTETQQYCWQR